MENYLSQEKPSVYDVTPFSVNLLNLLKADKGRDVVILDKGKCRRKCVTVLNATQFQKVYKDPVKTMERKVLNILLKIKPKLTINE